MTIERVLATEMWLLKPICEFIEGPGYTVFRSSRFRNYYGGNGLNIHEPRGGSLSEWEETFGQYFDSALYQHTTFLFPHDERFSRMVEEARAARYHVSFDSYMFVGNDALCRPLPAGLVVHRVATEGDWEKLDTFYSRSYAEADWFDPEHNGPDRLAEKRRFTSSELGIDWFYLTRAGEEEVLAALGLFEHAGICRLQDVETSAEHRRQGFASVLVSAAIDRALNTLGTQGLALCADSDYHAVDLYRKLGFVEVGATVTLMRYPIRNPLHMEEEKGVLA